MTRLQFNRLGIDQPITADPNLVGRVTQLWQNVTSLIVGDDDLYKAIGKVVSLGDDPNTGFRPVLAGDHSTDDVRCNGDISIRLYGRLPDHRLIRRLAGRLTLLSRTRADQPDASCQKYSQDI